METEKKYIAYYRVSTKKQGQSGLGLEAQKASVIAFTKCTECITREFVEVESGKNNARPQLAAALQAAKEQGATLVIAKLDRLSRNASFIFALRDSKVDFVCADMPEANSITIGIMAVLAQDERERTAKRTKDALAAKKAQGVKLGTPANLTEAARKKGMQVRINIAATKKENVQATELCNLYREQGLSLREIAAKLNDNGYKTSKGKSFQATTVNRLLNRP